MGFSTVLESLKKLNNKDKTEILQYFLDEEYHAKIDLSYCVECEALGSSTDFDGESKEFLKCKECDETFCKECSREKMYKKECDGCEGIFCNECIEKTKKCEICDAVFCSECIEDGMFNEKYCKNCEEEMQEEIKEKKKAKKSVKKH